MKRRSRGVFIFQCVLLAQAQQTPRALNPAFTVSIRLNVNPEPVQIQTGVYGRGLSLSEVRTRSGVYDYPIDISNSGVGTARSLKLLIYIPGYRMVASEFSAAELQPGKLFIPPLEPLPTAVVKGRLLDSGDKPLIDQTLRVEYHLIEAMGYFGYVDGGVPSMDIGSVRTN